VRIEALGDICHEGIEKEAIADAAKAATSRLSVEDDAAAEMAGDEVTAAARCKA
jgi:hypothetical protein